jgi:thiamine pyrophosphokinase
MMPAPVAVVFAGAPLSVTDRLRARIAALGDASVIAADSGAALALAFGLRPDLVVGDLDSLAASTRAELERLGVPFQLHPRAKDATDGQLALEHALSLNPSSVVLLGFLGGPRLDMSLSSVLLLLTTPARVSLLDERNECLLLRGPDAYSWSSEPGELVSLIPLDGECRGVTTNGLRYPLRDEPLVLGHTRGISNEPTARHVGVTVASGALLLTRHFPRL